MIITLIVAVMVVVMAAFSYVFLWSRRPDMWAPPPQTGLTLVLLSSLGAAGLAYGACRLLRLGRPRSAAVATLMMVIAAALIAVGWNVEIQAWLATGLRPGASGQGATVYAFLAWQGFFAAVVALMGVYAVLRWLAGHVKPDRPSTFDLIGLFIGYSAGQGAFAALLIRLFPGG
ncbi:MAG: hypothetical protein KXJ53_02095 [Phenylobacterium sp.]|nr:hypothetical protein [Phenylobacterium sp.]